MKGLLGCGLLLAAVAGCGDDGGGGSDGGTDSGRDSGPSDGGADSGGDAARDDGGPTDAGSDAFAPTACPATVPEEGAICDRNGLSCTYIRCPGAGVSQATCMGGSFSVATDSCVPYMCMGGGGIIGGGEMCEASQLCVARVGGAFIVSCEMNPCGEGPIVPECACTLCGGFPCMLDGRTVTCQTCPPGEMCA